MANKELMNALMREKTRLKAACGELTNRSAGELVNYPANHGFIAFVHMTNFSTMMLRCEFTVFMSMNAKKLAIEEEEFFRRVINQVQFEVKQMERALDVVVDQDGRCHVSGKPKLLKPGSTSPLN